MWETRQVELVLDLPADLADDVEQVRRDDPELLQRIIRYGLTRRAVYRELDRGTRKQRVPG